ncbi:nuclear condensing complex subunit [Gigaspora rosea]|uniref:Nuclear condensing complex subunit n=1 Tax=Gigaspora rosea TaxID=44941 RepID=A0A397VF37_9GLOM|nr:nuclear condensing complex subunit [Gigaspora rosea]
MSVQEIQENPIVTLSATIPPIFQDCQKSTGNHRRNAIALRKVQMKCSSYRSSNLESSNDQLDNERNQIANEQAFNNEFIRNLYKILPIKRVQPYSERVIKFVACFVAYSCEKDEELLNNQNDNTTVYKDTLSLRFTEWLIESLKPKIKTDYLYGCLKVELTKRLSDIEAGVRAKAVLACSKLQGDDDDGKYVIEQFIGMLRNDPSAEVRRVVIYNIEYNEETLAHILQRARDVDPINRRCVFMKIAEEINDFRVLSIEDREKLLSWGLTDSDPNVKEACVRMLSTSWIQHANDDLLELLDQLDVVRSNIAQEALISIFNARPDIVQMLNFDDIFWENLTAEGSFLVRVFCEYNKEDEGKLDEILPEVTRLAFYIQKYNNFMNQASDEEQDEGKLDEILPEVTRLVFYINKYNNLMIQASDEEQANLAFIVGQLFLLAKLSDYGDEFGRREMDLLLREMLMSSNILESHIESIVEIEKKFSINERDFTRSMIKIITAIHKGIDEMPVLSTDLIPTEKRVSNSSTSIDDNILNEMNVILVNLKCLHIIRCMLEKISENLRDNPSIYGLMNEIIIPNIQSHEPELRELGIQCLGLCCLLDQPLAVENYNLFMHCLRHGHPELQHISLMVMSDILMVYGFSTIVSSTQQGNEIIGLLQKCLTNENEQLQAIAVVGISKLMLSKMLRDKHVLKELVLLYFDSNTASNLCLRQCLSYFLPVFCHSSFENQTLMQEIFLPTLIELLKKYKNVEIAQQLVDWTNPFKVVKLEQTEETIDYGSHAELAISVIRELFSETDKDIMKLLCQILNKFQINKSAGVVRFKKLTFLVANLKSKHPLIDSMARDLLNKFEKNALFRHFDDAPDALDNNELKQLKEVFEFVEL